MSIADKINSIKTHLSDAYNAAEEKGGAMPSQKNKGREIIVKDEANKEWLMTKYPEYTNVKTKAEKEAE